MNPRRVLLELFEAGLRAVDGRACVAQQLGTMRPAPRVAVFAIGKAASSMARGALQVLGDSIQQMLVITKDGHLDPQLERDARATLIESAHPVPDARSLVAGAELTRRILDLTADTLPLFLVSGGASSLVESLADGVTLEELRAFNLRGLGAGWDIARLNSERSRLSRLKGGGVARLLAGRTAQALFISDVPGDDPDVIGSGLLGVDPPAQLPDRIERHVVANIHVAVRAVIEAAPAHGLTLRAAPETFDGEAAAVAAHFVDALRSTDVDGVVWGGESTVTLPASHGSGGRNTHLALAAARLFSAREPLTLLAAGTDGSDGPTTDAGAIVDSETRARAEIAGCDVERAFARFDSGTALAAAGDLLFTGPTGTNVGDILIGVRRAGASVRDDAPARML